MTEEHEPPSRVWAGLHIQHINASIKPFMLLQRIVESFASFCCTKDFSVFVGPFEAQF